MDIPLYPFARTLIRSASSIRVFEGLNGFPTPAAWDLIRFICSSLENPQQLRSYTGFENMQQAQNLEHILPAQFVFHFLHKIIQQL